jgi:outer membrane protein assembly factor BamB
MIPLPVRLLVFCVSCTILPTHLFGAESEQPASIEANVAWKFQTGKEVTSAPTVAEGVVYCGSTNGSFFALDAETGQLRWKFSALYPISGKAAVSSELVCIGSGNTLYGLDKKSGLEKWHYTAKGYRPIFSLDLTDYHRSSPVIADGVVYYGDDWGNLNGVDLATGEPVFQFTTESGRPIRSTPVVRDNVVYFGDWEGEVYAVSLVDRKLRWTYRLENVRPYYGAIVSEFVIQDGVLYFGSQHEIFSPLDITNGNPVWKFADANKTYLPSTPLIYEGKVVIGSTVFTNAVLCLSKGEIVWSYKADGIFFTKPILDGQVIIINSTNFGKTGYLYFLDFRTGTLINKLTIEKASPSAPEISGRKLYLGAGDGCIYALDLNGLLPTALPTP